jgi:mono/diheme cytochrome c family protein
MRLGAVLLLGALVFFACGGSDETESSAAATTTDVVSTTTEVASTTADVVSTTTEVASTTLAPTTTTEPPTTTTTISAERLTAAAAVGDIAAGEELFNEPLDGITHSLSCSSCHTLDGQLARNPTFIGIGMAAADRIEGTSDVEYLRQSIVDPSAFKPDGEWGSAAMPYTYPDVLSEDQINNVIAYLLTR